MLLVGKCSLVRVCYKETAASLDAAGGEVLGSAAAAGGEVQLGSVIQRTARDDAGLAARPSA